MERITYKEATENLKNLNKQVCATVKALLNEMPGKKVELESEMDQFSFDGADDEVCKLIRMKKGKVQLVALDYEEGETYEYNLTDDHISHRDRILVLCLVEREHKKLVDSE
jgi:hypothetical protein